MRVKQEDQRVKVNDNYVASLRPAWDKRPCREVWRGKEWGEEGEKDREREIILSFDITYTNYVYLGTGEIAQSVKSLP